MQRDVGLPGRPWFSVISAWHMGRKPERARGRQTQQERVSGQWTFTPTVPNMGHSSPRPRAQSSFCCFTEGQSVSRSHFRASGGRRDECVFPTQNIAEQGFLEARFLNELPFYKNLPVTPRGSGWVNEVAERTYVIYKLSCGHRNS